MTRKLIISLVIVISLSMLVSAQKKKSRNVNNLKKEVIRTDKEIQRCFPKKPKSAMQKKMRIMLDDYIHDWNLAREKFNSKLKNKKISKQAMKELQDVFDKTVANVENYLNQPGERFTLNAIKKVSSTMDTFSIGFNKVVSKCNAMGEKANDALLNWMEGYRKSSADFLKGCLALFEESENMDQDDDDDDDALRFDDYYAEYNDIYGDILDVLFGDKPVY